MKVWQNSRVLTVLSLIPIGGSALFSAFFSTEASAQMLSQTRAQPVFQQPERVLSVTGSGAQMIPTTRSQVTLGVAVQASTAEAAQQQVAQRQTAVIEWLRSQSVENLETTGIFLSPRYDYQENQQRLIGYEATNTVSFRIPTEQAGTTIDGAISAGATRIDGVSFIADAAAVDTARQQALTAAITDAEQQADTVLAALGLTRQEVIRIGIGEVSAPPTSPVAARSQRVAEDATTPIVGQSQTINAQVTLEIRY